ncbi:Mini-ribonuclease 3 [Lyngbya confervoides]|uniref:Mini-ribonuclease 3 n=1 Tax=Lyngbya confervoides BDU141951 TaxID=1574623 RepID=A0ABD4T944_9CYAN|nr:ribonuclease III domain-containing protein [Lyngbya confervoides]MCM1985005.1 ribonuclease III [Lyngbya confervoides BDU141951]
MQFESADLFSPARSMREVQALSPASLAYLGDAVFELLARSHFAFPPQRIQTYHQQVVAQVKAESQAEFVQILLPYLTESELTIYRRGRNAAFGKPKRLSLSIYQQASGFEALLGYLFLTDQARLQELLTQIPPALGS